MSKSLPNLVPFRGYSVKDADVAKRRKFLKLHQPDSPTFVCLLSSNQDDSRCHPYLGLTSVRDLVDTIKVDYEHLQMDTSDLVIIVEHCCGCESHNISLRHDESKYVELADNMLAVAAKTLHGLGLNLRVGVLRHPTKNPKRIGMTPK